jgi:hypothetical protein
VFCRLVLRSTKAMFALESTAQAAAIKSSKCVEVCDELLDN